MKIPLTTLSRPEGHRPSSRERCVSFCLCGILISIALSIFAIQFRFDPARWRAQPDETARLNVPDPAFEAASSLSRSAALEGVQPMSPPEYFGADGLSDKIDGKAELYLASGFRHLESRRLFLTDAPGLWIERFVYDMGAYANAFAVFSQQRRGAARSLDLAPDAYRTANGIFFVQGRYYVEIIGSDAFETILDKIAALARAFVDEHPVAPVALDERSLFPKTGLVADSITLTASNAFGFDEFDRIYSARYQWDGQSATAFVSRRTSAEEAARLAETYVRFLVSYGGEPVDPPDHAPPLQIIEILDYVQIVFTHGDLLGGVHEADDLARGLALAEQLYHHMMKGDHER